jgi:MFS family permease
LLVTNLVMVGVMAMAPVHLAGHGVDLDLVGLIISVHAAGMFAPAPLSGWAADRVGAAPVATAGILLLIVAGLAGALVDQQSAPVMTLVLAGLGVGWNFGVVGGSSMLSTAVPAAQRSSAEGLGEVAMSLGAVVGAPGAGLIVALAGFTAISVLGAAVAVVGLMIVRLAVRP